MNKFVRGAAAAAFLIVGFGAKADPTLTGEYVEARTANVYTGACHANGEYVTTGREALMVWHISRGEVKGVRVDGLTAVAVIVSGQNLAENGARRAILYVDAKATPAQREALAASLTGRYGKTLGQIVAVKSAPIAFTHKGLEYTVRVSNAVYLKTTRYACDHCIMPHAIWYEPLVGLKSSLVAKATVNEFKGAPELATRWLRSAENSSYVGDFAF